MLHSFTNDKGIVETWLNLKCRRYLLVETDFYCTKFAPFFECSLPVQYDDTISFVRFAYDDGIIMAKVMQGSLLFFREAKRCSAVACGCDKMWIYILSTGPLILP